MNRIIASAAMLLALAGSAFAAETEGTVQAVDPTSRTILLVSGESFTASEEVALDALTPGTKVKITYDEGSTNATSVETTM